MYLIICLAQAIDFQTDGNSLRVAGSPKAVLGTHPLYNKDGMGGRVAFPGSILVVLVMFTLLSPLGNLAGFLESR